MAPVKFIGGQRVINTIYNPSSGVHEPIDILPIRHEVTKPGGIKATMISSLAIIAIGIVLLALMFGAPFAIAIGKFLLHPMNPVPVWAQIGIGALILIIIFRVIRRK